MDDQGPVAYYDVTAKTGAVGIVPGILTPVSGYNGVVPAKRIDVEQGTRIVMTMHNQTAHRSPDIRYPHGHLDPSARVCVAAAI